MDELTYIVGEVVAFFFENPQNFYKVVLVRVEETNTDYFQEEIVITGTFGQLHQDVSYKFSGNLVSHPKYGQQFSAFSYEQAQPTGEWGLIKYLSSERFPGIGEKTASKIVQKHGLETIDVIINDETALNSISGLNEKKRRMIREVLIQHQGTEKGLIYLTNLGFSPALAQKIVQQYREKTTDIIEENPYILLKDIEGIGFKRIDAIAKQMNIVANAPCRIQGAIFTVIREICFQLGHTYLFDNEVVLHTQKLLETSQSYLIEPEEIVENINELIREGTVIVEENRISLAVIYFAELGIFNFLQRVDDKKKRKHLTKNKIDKAIKKTEKKYGILYDEKQKEAIFTAVTAPVFILTGGPGTGKTTVINGIIDVYSEVNEIDILSKKSEIETTTDILLAAPTGRAAKRMSELTGMPATTIHRLLGLTADDGELMQDYAFETRDLVGKLLIVDEMSMVDSFLMNRLLKAIPPNMQVVLVGDSNQLPSVGPGQVLSDLISSSTIEQIELERIFRQQESSSIIDLAHEINCGVLPLSIQQSTTDRSFISCQSHQIQTVVEQVVQKAIDKGFTKRDIQVLAPMYKGEAGINAINGVLQNLLNPIIGKSKRQVEHFERVFRVGDKVLQLVNRADASVYNGDIGEIVAVQFANENEDQVDKLFVAFDQIEMEYPRSEWQQLTLAYCCSIHKAQGSEFKLVILPMVHAYQRMLKRNLLYTAITRSKELLIMCGQKSAFEQAVTNRAADRQTVLKELLLEQKEKGIAINDRIDEENREKYQSQPTILVEPATKVLNNIEHEFHLTEEMIINEVIDPLIGMEAYSPYENI